MEYQIEQVKTYIGSRRTTNSKEANARSARHIVEAEINTCRCGYSFISFFIQYLFTFELSSNLVHSTFLFELSNQI